MNNIPSRRKALGQLAAMTAAPMLAASPFRHVYAQTAICISRPATARCG